MIYYSSQSLFHDQLTKLYTAPQFKSSPRGLFVHENIGFSSVIEEPRHRIIFSKIKKFDLNYALGETLWYLKGDNSLKMIQNYAPSYDRFSDDGTTLNGAYGPRIHDNLNNVINKLKNDSDSRQAIILIWRKEELKKQTKDLPCTVYLQFFIRENKLYMITNMRSNDLWLGLPYDIFAFTIIQEYIASLLKVEIGHYQHNAGSLHIYENAIKKLSEQEQTIHPISTPMKPIRNWSTLSNLLSYEEELRNNKILPSKDLKDLYDLGLVLYLGKCKKEKSELSSDLIDSISCPAIKKYFKEI